MHQSVQPAEFLFREFDGAPGGTDVGHVTLAGGNRRTKCVGKLCCCREIMVGADYAGAFRNAAPGNGGANAACGARDQDNASLQSVHRGDLKHVPRRFA